MELGRYPTPQFPYLDALRNMQPRLRPIAPYQAPGGPPPLTPPGSGLGVGVSQPPGITGPYPMQPFGPMPYGPATGGPLRSPVEGGLPNLMALRSMMQRTPYSAY
jgi:hypothetical protein